jgi:hypothetical protein
MSLATSDFKAQLFCGQDMARLLWSGHGSLTVVMTQHYMVYYCEGLMWSWAKRGAHYILQLFLHIFCCDRKATIIKRNDFLVSKLS